MLRQLNGQEAVVRLMDVIQSHRSVHFVLEYVDGGSLQQLLRSEGKLAEDRARTLSRSIAAALSICHQHCICHRDLKPDNVMLLRNADGVHLALTGPIRRASAAPTPHTGVLVRRQSSSSGEAHRFRS